MSGEAMDTFRALLVNPPTNFANILKKARIQMIEIHSQEPGDVLTVMEIKDLYIPQKGEEIRFFQNDIVAVRGKTESVYSYARVQSISQSVLTLVVSLEPEETTEDFGPEKYAIVFKLKKDILAMKMEIEQEKFTAEVSLLCDRTIDESRVEAINAFLVELETLLKKGEDLTMKIPPILPTTIKKFKDLLKLLNEKKEIKEMVKEQQSMEENLPPPPPSEEDIELANKEGMYVAIPY
jgi:hypothetical protein